MDRKARSYKHALESIYHKAHNPDVPWTVLFHEQFEPEFGALDEAVQDDLLARLEVIREFGPKTGRPAVDTLAGSKHANMKELRFSSSSRVWRFAFAFDPGRRAVILCGGTKSGKDEKRFYRSLIDRADRRFSSYLKDLAER